MEKSFILPALILNKSMDTKRAQFSIYSKKDDTGIIILIDDKETLVGYVDVAFFYKTLHTDNLLGLKLEYIMNTDYIAVSDISSLTTSKLAERKPVIITDTSNRPLGILDKISYLMSTATQYPDFPNFELSADFFQKFSSAETYNFNGKSELLNAKKALSIMYTILDSSYDEIFVINNDGICIFVNSACKRLYGVEKEDLLGKNLDQIVKMNMTSSIVCDKALKERRRITNIQTTATKRKIIATANPLLDLNGNHMGVVMNSREVLELSNVYDFLYTEVNNENDFALFSRMEGQMAQAGIISESEEMKRVSKTCAVVSQIDSNVLLLGESGVGKNLMAKLIHDLSNRSDKPFVIVNCGSLPKSLLESELFGYDKGAFTGAKNEGKAGFFEKGNGGTIFLDEIAEIPLDMQAALLHVLQYKTVMRIGGSEVINLDFRVITATNRDLKEMVAMGEFREDLYYRLNVIPVTIPPLRERPVDVPYMVQAILRKINDKYHLNKSFDTSAMDLLIAYDWPGNIRELENTIERIAVTSMDSVIKAEDLDIDVKILNKNKKNAAINLDDIVCLKDAVDNYEREILREACITYETTYDIARVLNVNQSTIVRKLQKYNLHLKQKSFNA